MRGIWAADDNESSRRSFPDKRHNLIHRAWLKIERRRDRDGKWLVAQKFLKPCFALLKLTNDHGAVAMPGQNARQMKPRQTERIKGAYRCRGGIHLFPGRVEKIHVRNPASIQQERINLSVAIGAVPLGHEFTSGNEVLETPGIVPHNHAINLVHLALQNQAPMRHKNSAIHT